MESKVISLKKPSKVSDSLDSPCLCSSILSYLTNQVSVEMTSANIYLAMSQWANERGYLGSAEYFKKQYEEEMKHAHKMLEYIADRNCETIIPAVPEQRKDYIDVIDLFETQYKHEKYVTSTYVTLSKMCLDESDFVTFALANWYLNEQIEEEAKSKNQLDELYNTGKDQLGIYLFDKELND